MTDFGTGFLLECDPPQFAEYEIEAWPVMANVGFVIECDPPQFADYEIKPWPAMADPGFHLLIPAEGGNWTVSLAIDGGAEQTSGNEVALAIHADESGVPASEMSFSPDGVAWGEWVPYATTATFVLAPQSVYPSEARTVWVRFRL